MSIGMITHTNLISMNSQMFAGRNQGKLNDSIHKLSSGMRINYFKDDPSRMSISEKMRGFVLGLQTATRNAQDGISYLQTAEGASGEITSMLQRMRELAVQGSNGTYTTTDRLEIQKEMDQLKEEIDRIADHTQFNTKKLINGESSGAWNSGSEKIQAIVNGTVADGNYDIDFDVTPGLNQVQSSQVLTIKDGKLGAEIANNNGTNIGKVSSPTDISTTTENEKYNVNVTNPQNAQNVFEDTFTLNGGFQNKESVVNVNTDTAVTTFETSESGYFVVEFTENKKDDLENGKVRVKFISARTGEEGEWKEFNITKDPVTNISSIAGAYSDRNQTVDFNIELTAGSSNITKGDKFLFALSDTKGLDDQTDLLANGGGVVQIGKGKEQGPKVVFDGANSLTKKDNFDGVNDYNDVKIHTVNVDPVTGEIKKGSVDLGFLEGEATKAGSMEMEVRGGGQHATLTTKIGDIANFTDANGVNLLANTQEITIYGNSGNTKIYLEAEDTVQDVVNKLKKAIVEDLKMGSGDTNTNKNLVSFSKEKEDGHKAVPGTLILQSALTGKDSELSFVGPQAMLDALGFNTVQEATQNIQKVTVKNNLNGVLVGERLTSDTRLDEIIPGLDLIVDTRTGVDARYDEGLGKVVFEKSDRLENRNLNLHIVDNRTEIQIGTVKGEKADVSIASLKVDALGLQNTNINSQEASQRAITEIDNALTKVTSERAKMGAQINRLEYAMNSLAAHEENTTASESRIRDTNVAAETTAMTMAQVGYQANIALLAQANQIPGMALQLLQG